MLLTDIATCTMELPAKGSKVMTRVEDEDEFAQWVQTTLNEDASLWSPVVQATDDRDRVLQAGVHPLPLSWPMTTQFIT